jgi:hypothetical protein
LFFASSSPSRGRPIAAGLELFKPSPSDTPSAYAKSSYTTPDPVCSPSSARKRSSA